MNWFQRMAAVSSAAGVRRVWCWLLLALVGGAASVARAADKWVHGQSENFEMLSSVSEKETRRILLDLEQFRANVLRLFPVRTAREPRVSIVVFKSDSSFRPYQPLYQGKPKEVSGLFVDGADEVVIAMSAEGDADIQDPFETIFHEYLHLLMHTRGVRLPAWLDEGLAEVFSTFRTDGKFAEYGRPKQIYVDVLNFSALLPLEKLIAVDQSSPEYNEEDRATMFYAESWALTHFLLCGEDRTNAAKLSRYVDLLDKSKLTTVEAFDKVFGKDYNGMVFKLRAYLEGGRYYQRRSPLLPIDESKLAVRAATPFERDLMLRDLQWRVHRTEEVVPYVRALGEQQPDSPRPAELLGTMAAARGDVEEAFEHWHRAERLKTDNAFVYVQLAHEKLIKFDLAEFDERLEPAIALELQHWLDRALMLRPGYADAVETLAITESRAPSLRIPGINAVQLAVPRLKEPDATLLALAVIRWRAKDMPTCLQICDVLIGSPRAPGRVKAAARLLRLRAAQEAPAPAAAKPPAAPP